MGAEKKTTLTSVYDKSAHVPPWRLAAHPQIFFSCPVTASPDRFALCGYHCLEKKNDGKFSNPTSSVSRTGAHNCGHLEPLRYILFYNALFCEHVANKSDHFVQLTYAAVPQNQLAVRLWLFKVFLLVGGKTWSIANRKNVRTVRNLRRVKLGRF